jgi:hypothetical protein
MCILGRKIQRCEFPNFLLGHSNEWQGQKTKDKKFAFGNTLSKTKQKEN